MRKAIFTFQKHKISAIFSLILLIIPVSIFAQVMQSPNYKMSSDSVNVGGLDSSSTNYKLNDTTGEIATGDSNSANYYMHAGFWQMQESYISISNPNDLVLTSMGGINGAASEGTMNWVVTTDNTAGYSMSIKSSRSPALQSAAGSFSDYSPSGADPDYNFSIDPSASAFGFSPEGVDTSARFKDNDFVCNAGTNETTGRCWDGLSTSYKTIFQRGTSNHQSGSNLTVRFRAESGTNHIQSSGNYTAPIIVTAITL